jgi:reactive intermediate/imine deaminase
MPPVFHRSPAAAAAGLPFSEAVRLGDVLYLSGAIGHRPGTLELVPGGLAAETRQALAHIKAVLAEHGLGLDAVFKVTVMLADMARWAEFNAVYLEHVDPARLPARSAFGATALALGAQVELDCLAYAGPR